MAERIPVLILAGLSGVGKTAVANAIFSSDGRFMSVRSATTRPPRGDANDAEYIYMTDEEFDGAVERGEFVETATYSGKRYGTLRSELFAAAELGKIPLLILEMNGVESFFGSEEYDPCSVYIYADIATAGDRLLERTGTEKNGRRPFAWVIRAERNIMDALKHCRYAHMFYAAVDNRSSVEECAEGVIAAFDSFMAGVPSEPRKISEVFLSLTDQAMRQLEHPMTRKK
ncbi:MAG: hypothetical protein IJX38_04635 [Clostridia bacterium]|nr:hypothetical protein [Clostridia bacterium]